MLRLKTIPEFAEIKNCSRQTVYNAINRGELDTIVKFGKKLINLTKKNKSWEAKESMKR